MEEKTACLERRRFVQSVKQLIGISSLLALIAPLGIRAILISQSFTNTTAFFCSDDNAPIEEGKNLHQVND